MPLTKEWATYYCNKRLHFSQRITLLVKSINQYLKSFIIIRSSFIQEYILQLIIIVNIIKENIKEVIKAEKGRL